MHPIEREQKRAQLASLVAGGLSLAKAARRVKVSPSTASKLLADTGLREARMGRKPSIELTNREQAALKRAMLVRNSLPLAVRDLIRDEECTEPTRRALKSILDRAADERKRPSFPPSLRRAARVTAEMKALFRGGKRVEDYQLLRPRGDFIVDPLGNRVELAPNVIWESDDMSVNTPFCWIDPDSGGWLTGRQTLITGDRYSRAYLGVTAIGRSRDAYRVEDIADHILHCVETHGMPYIWRIERGVWDNKFIFGIKTKSGRTWGGLCDIIHIQRTWTSGGKGFIEGSFNHLQNLMAHESLDIGRSRGEFARAAQLMRQAQAGQDKALAHLWTIDECTAAMLRAMGEFNTSQKSLRAQGTARMSPAELYGDFVARPLPEKDRWRFCPIKKELTVRRGIIQCRVPHYPDIFYFQINGIDGAQFVEQGTPVLAAFHPGRPEEGAYIFNALETSDVRNAKRLPWGAYMMKAPMLELAPQVNLDPLSERDGRKKKAAAAMRAEYRAVIPNGTHPHCLKAHSESRDQLGQALRSRIGGETVQPAESAYLPHAPAKPKKRPYKLKSMSELLNQAKKNLDL